MTDRSRPAFPRPVILCVLDGWGWRETREDNAVALADTPCWDRLMATEPNAFLGTSGADVGLPDGQMGNSEVGHMNLGAGRVVLADLPRIDHAVAEGALDQAPALLAAVDAARDAGGVVHIMGLMSPGGVHSHQTHIAALVRAAAARGAPVRVHAFMDGRDTPPSSGRGFLEAFHRAIADAGADAADARVATVCGRFYAMDRDKRWDRVERAWRAIVLAEGEGATDADAAMAAAAERGETDEFVAPTVIGDYAGIRDGDALVMANFRADRARELLTALVDPDFDGFARPRTPRLSAACGVVEYSDALNQWVTTIFPPEACVNTLGEYASGLGLRQLRIAETEKYPHVTFFLNGGREEPFDGEVRILTPSPKVKTYDLQPEMSAPEVTDKLVAAIDSGEFDLIVVNYANADMVGHTGDLAAAIRAIEALDGCLARLEAAVVRAGGVMFTTADHGNAEMMRDPESGERHTQHTTLPVPAVLVNAAAAGVTALVDGRLADVAPTLLALMGRDPPAEMTGRVLIRRDQDDRLGRVGGAADEATANARAGA